jgi:hypothetical protein
MHTDTLHKCLQQIDSQNNNTQYVILSVVILTILKLNAIMLGIFMSLCGVFMLSVFMFMLSVVSMSFVAPKLEPKMFYNIDA